MKRSELRDYEEDPRLRRVLTKLRREPYLRPRSTWHAPTHLRRARLGQGIALVFGVTIGVGLGVFFQKSQAPRTLFIQADGSPVEGGWDAQHAGVFASTASEGGNLAAASDRSRVGLSVGGLADARRGRQGSARASSAIGSGARAAQPGNFEATKDASDDPGAEDFSGAAELVDSLGTGVVAADSSSDATGDLAAQLVPGAEAPRFVEGALSVEGALLAEGAMSADSALLSDSGLLADGAVSSSSALQLMSLAEEGLQSEEQLLSEVPESSTGMTSEESTAASGDESSGAESDNAEPGAAEPGGADAEPSEAEADAAAEEANATLPPDEAEPPQLPEDVVAWKVLAEERQFGEALSALVAVGGFEQAFSNATSEELVLLSEIARAAGLRERAIQALRLLTTRFEDSPLAVSGALNLGHLLSAAGDRAGAERAYALSRELQQRREKR